MKVKPTILGLMGVIAFIAIGMAALRSNDELWTAVVFALTVFTLCTATLIALSRRGAWAGFVIFGWAQFWICQPHSAPPVGPTSLTMGIACQLVPYANASNNLPPPSFNIGGYPAIASDNNGKPILMAVSGGSAGRSGYVPVHSLRVALCLMSLIVGFVGAIVGGFIARWCVVRPDSIDYDRPRLTTLP